MNPSATVIQALLAAIEQNPEDAALRLHLAPLLLESGDAAGCLDQISAVLLKDPANLEALRLGEQAAQAVGDTTRAEGYGRLVLALGGAPAAPPQKAAPDPYDLSQLVLDDETEQRPGRRMRPDPAPREAVPASRLDEDEDEIFLEVERPDLRLNDVAGMHDVKRRLEVAFLGPMRNPELMRTYRKSLRGGLLLYGPPGCGKTFVARAVAGELGARFIPVGLTDVMDMWFGESERKLESIFDIARRNAPCVLFFDEVDAIGQKRSELRGGAGRNLVNQLLAQLDSLGANNDGVFTLAATNCPWDVDPALRRPGRFDRMMLVLPPDEPAREAALRYHMRDRPTANLDYRWLANHTADFSGADLAHLCDSAAEVALEASIREGTTHPIEMAQLRRAMKDVRPSTRSWFETARNYALFANQDGGYDELIAYIKARRL